MSQEQLQRMLRESADRIGVGPPAYDGIARVEQRRRGRRMATVAAAAVTVLMVGGVLAVLGARSQDAPTPTVPSADTRLDLVTSDWEPGNGGDGALLTGTLALDEEGCVYLRQPDGSRSWAAWPQGWTAVEHPDHNFSLFDADGHVVAHRGDLVSVGGGGGSTAYAGQRCMPDSGGEFVVQSDLTVLETRKTGFTTYDFALSTNGYRDDRPAATRFQGVLRQSDGCLEIGAVLSAGMETQQAAPVYLSWPKGYTATTDPDGRLTMFDATGDAVAHDGDTISVPGLEGDEHSPTGCRSDAAPVSVNGPVTVIDPG